VDTDSIKGAGLTQLTLCGSGDAKLRAGTIAWISALPSLKNLGLTGWGSWDDPSSLGQLPITHIFSDAGPCLLSDMLAAGGLQSLQSATLHAQNHSLGSKEIIAALAHGLLELQDFEFLGCSEAAAGGANTSGIERTVHSIVKLHKDRWLCLSSRGYTRLFERVKAAE